MDDEDEHESTTCHYCHQPFKDEDVCWEGDDIPVRFHDQCIRDWYESWGGEFMEGWGYHEC